MATAGSTRMVAALRGACFGARAGAIFAAAEALAFTLWPISSAAAPTTAVGAQGLALLGLVWVAGGALAGAGLAAQGAADSARGDARLAALAVLPPILAVAAHAIRVTPPVSRLGFVLAGAAIAAALVLARARRPGGWWLRQAAAPWTLAAWLVALSMGVFDFARHASVGRQALVAVGLAALVFGLATLIGAALSLRARKGAADRGPRPVHALAAALCAWLVAVGVGSAAERGGAPVLPAAREASRADRPSVLFITLDTVRSDHLSLYGYARDTTPRLSLFAAGATRYTRAIAASDLTLSTHASLFTGLYTVQHGARVDPGHGSTALADEFQTLAEILRDAGYLTLGVVGNPAYLATRYGLAQGFDHYDDRHPPSRIPELPSHLPGHSIAAGARALGVGGEAFTRAEESYRVAEAMNREVFALLDVLAGRPDPFLLFVNYMDAHWPYDPPPPYDTRFAVTPGGAGDPLGVEEFRAARLLKAAPSEARRLQMVSLYDGEIAYLDAALGRLFDRMQALGLLERTLVVITSDHGEAFGEHGLYAHGVSVYQDQVHVPLLIRLPGQTEGVVSDVVTSSVDLLPTVLEAVGVPLPARPGGRRLAGSSLIGDGPPAQRVVLSESYPDSALVAARPSFRRVQRALFDGDRKLIASSAGPRELYDLRGDPEEQHDLYADPGDVSHLEAALAAWLAEDPSRAGAAPVMDEALRRRLHALGYAR